MALRWLTICLWLFLPIGGLLMLRAHYHAYLNQLDSQQTAAHERADELRYHQQTLNLLAEAVPGMYLPEQRDLWELELRQAEEELQQGLPTLPSGAFSLLPRTGQTLASAESALLTQDQALRSAGSLQDAYIKAGNGLSDLEWELEQARQAADYYAALGVFGVYIRLQDIVAQLEVQFQRQVDAQQRAREDCDQQLAAVDAAAADLRQALDDLDQRIMADRSATYRDELAKRYASFDIRGELNAFLHNWATEPLRVN